MVTAMVTGMDTHFTLDQEQAFPEVLKIDTRKEGQSLVDVKLEPKRS